MMRTIEHARIARKNLGARGEGKLRELLRAAGYGPELTDIDGDLACTLVYLADNQTDHTISSLTSLFRNAQVGDRARDRARLVTARMIETMAIAFAGKTDGVAMIDEMRAIASDLTIDEMATGDVFRRIWEDPRGLG